MNESRKATPLELLALACFDLSIATGTIRYCMHLSHTLYKVLSVLDVDGVDAEVTTRTKREQTVRWLSDDGKGDPRHM